MGLAPVLESAQGTYADGPQCLVACSQAVPSRYILVPDNIGCQVHPPARSPLSCLLLFCCFCFVVGFFLLFFPSGGSVLVSFSSQVGGT